MKKLLFVIGVLCFIGLIANSAKAEEGGLVKGSQGRNMTVVDGSSASVNSPCTVYAIWLSTAQENENNYGVLVDSPIATANATFSAYTAAQTKTPALIFPSSGTISGTGTELIAQPIERRVQLGGDYGVRCSSAATFWKSDITVGQANRAWIEWGF